MKSRICNPMGMKLCLIALGVCIFSAANVYGQSKVLRWNLKEGQNFKIEIVQEQTQKMNTPQGEMEIPMNQTVNIDWKVSGVEDEKFHITQVIKRIQMTMDAPMMEMEYDSDAEEAEGMGAQLAGVIDPLIDAEISFKMDARGNVSDVEIPEDVLEEMEAGSNGMMGAQMFSADSIKQFVNQAGLVLPEDPVSGDTAWSHEVSQDNPMMTMNITSDYKYVGEEEVDGKKIHKISVSSNVELEDVETPFGGSIEIDEQESNGEIWFDNEAGYLTGSKSTQTMIMLMDIMGQEMDMESEVKVEVKVTPVSK